MSATVYTIDFDFSSSSQNTILKYLQDNNYKLMGYKGASGPNQVTSGLPTWFAEPFINMLPITEIEYEPLYKVYVSDQEVIGANTTVKVSAMSNEYPLGTSLIMDSAGNFTTNPADPAPAGTITIQNGRPAGTPNVTVGLAAKVNGEYSPFCAFTCTPEGSVNMAPTEKVCLFAAQTNLVSGSVVGATTTPGCSFDFDSSNIAYSLEMIPSTFGITNVSGTSSVAPVGSGASLVQLLNS